MFRNDRVARSGGAAIYIKKGLKGLKSKLIRSSVNIKSEYLFFLTLKS